MAFSSETPYFFGIILLLIGFLAGYALSEFLLRGKQRKGDREKGDNSAYLNGINYILSNEPDKAIEAFSRAVQINSDTIETYLALGNLFRNKGELSRAIRIHQSIIVRPNIDRDMKQQALHDLGLDFKKAGFVERAINAFEEVVAMAPKLLDAHLHLLDLYEDVKEWEKAYQVQAKISKLRKSSDNNVLAHHLAEMGKSYVEKGLLPQAKKSFKKSISLDGKCIDAYLHLGDLFYAENNYNKAIATWKMVMEAVPGFTYLAYPRLEEAYFKLNEFSKIGEILRENSKKNYNDIHTHFALAEHLYKKSFVDEAINELKIVLELNPSNLKARQTLGRYMLEQEREAEAVEIYQAIFDDFPLPEKNFQCSHCGYESKNLSWRCPKCRKWDKIMEKPYAVVRKSSSTAT
ncbi:MAG: tetratricopeptide repeat protein [Deltaproteobacteria bacterium]|nr:tetratricopeptide repeat protein [Deltaproteobacteria bacterium]